MELYTDLYYIKRIREGDTGSFACLVDRYSRSVFSLILKIVQNREDAEELAQDVFIKLFRKLDSFQGESSFSTWLYRIAYNTAISHTRKKKHEFLTIEEATIENESGEKMDNLLHESTSEQQLVILENALEKLSPEDRGLILLFYMENKSIEDITVISGLTLSNVKTRLHRIRKKLYSLVKKMEESYYEE